MHPIAKRTGNPDEPFRIGKMINLFVIRAKAGTQTDAAHGIETAWVPAFAGMTKGRCA
jgi:hypothetical protein